MLSAVEEIQPKYVFISFADEQEMKKDDELYKFITRKKGISFCWIYRKARRSKPVGH